MLVLLNSTPWSARPPSEQIAMEILSNNPGTPVEVTEPQRRPINIGTGMHSWSHNNCYAYVFDEEGDQIFTINTTSPTEELVAACLEAYFDGHCHGFKSGAKAKLREIKKALEITEPNRLG